MVSIRVLDLGHMAYREAWDQQLLVWDEVAAGGPDTLILVSHPPVLTLGANFHEENLLFPRAAYEERGIEIVPTDRGGDVTYHGPGQLVIYPIFDLRRHGQDLHRWLRDLEQAIIDTLAAFNLEGRRFPPHTGVWVGDEKVAAIGIKVRKWISLHGIALNIDPDLSVYDTFVPCGIRGYGVTSLAKLMGEAPSVATVKEVAAASLSASFSAF